MQSYEELAEEVPSFRENQSRINASPRAASRPARRRRWPGSWSRSRWSSTSSTSATLNISKTQINSQITALNKDFRAQNPDRSKAPPVFASVSCGNGPNGDMFMNYMDYTDDAAMFMFTPG
jgi:hypothetical protein